MKHPERVEDYLEHIAEAIERATSYLLPLKNTGELQRDQQVQDAIVRNIEIIGEAANKIHKMDIDFASIHPDLPWIEMRGMRNQGHSQLFRRRLGDHLERRQRRLTPSEEID